MEFKESFRVSHLLPCELLSIGLLSGKELCYLGLVHCLCQSSTWITPAGGSKPKRGRRNFAARNCKLSTVHYCD